MSTNKSALLQTPRRPTHGPSSRSFLRFFRFRKAWAIALTGGFLLAWGTNHLGYDFFDSFSLGFDSDTHLAAPSNETPERNHRPRYQRRSWRQSPFDQAPEPVATPEADSTATPPQQ